MVQAELRRGEELMSRPRYITWVSHTQFYLCETLADALEWAGQVGGWVYEPLAATTAERIAAEPDEANEAKELR